MDRQNSNTAAIPERSRGNQNWFWLIPFVLLFMPLVTNEYQQYIINLMLIYVPVAIGFNLVTGNLGQLAFSNLAFFSAGANTSGVLSMHLGRSEEHTSELQSLMRISYAVFCLKKQTININTESQNQNTTTPRYKTHS